MKLYRYTDSTEPIFYYDTKRQVEVPEVYIEKDVRAIWVSNVVNIDLPIIQQDGTEYKQLLDKLIQTCLEYNINNIYFQVRTTNDAFYKSELNPYSRFLVGEEGQKPPFDIFQYLIEESKKRNIDVHAWCNPYRISANGNLSIEDYLATCDDKNSAKQHPEWIVLDDKGKLILNPAKQEVKQFIFDTMKELCENYDIAGIHFDDYFYPYADLHKDYNDVTEFELRTNQEETLEDFRRRQVTEVIKGVFDTIKSVDPAIQFGVSPFGIWRNKNDHDLGSNTGPACGQSYHMLSADSYKWVKEGYMDYVVPQIYWPFGHPIARFMDVCDWWVDLVKGTNVKLYIGHGAYRLGQQGEFSNPMEIVNQLKYANQYKEVDGNVFFTYHNFIDQNECTPGMLQLKKLLNEV